MARDARARGKWQGMNWIRQEKRLAIHLRDGLACAYCGEGIEDGAQLSLDHIIPHSRGGSNAADNLITACRRCNSSRQDRPVEEFASAVAAYLDRGITADEILAHIEEACHRELPMAEAKAMIARRGSAARALKEAEK